MPKKGPAPAKTEANVPATIVVSLPANATLKVDGNATTSTSARRTFVTPALEGGVEYFYVLTAEVVIDGQRLVQTQNVVVRAGQTSEVPFTFTPAVASR